MLKATQEKKQHPQYLEYAHGENGDSDPGSRAV